MDTTYFGRSFGVMVFRDYLSKKNLYWQFVKYETIYLYKSGIAHLQGLGWDIQAIVCDGKPGVLKGFSGIPTQMCQFHQVAIVTRYLTKKPKLQAGVELKAIVSILAKTDKESFAGLLHAWFVKWSEFLSEKTVNSETGKIFYTHGRLRSAYNSLQRNLNYLFTWYDHPHINIPNTTNSLDGFFTNLKTKVRVHPGLKKSRKIKIIQHLLKK
jgi:hypothetical protein